MNKQIVKAYWPSFRKYWWLWVITLITMSVNVGLQAVSPYYMRGIVDTFTSDQPDLELAEKLFWKMVVIAVAIIILYRLFDFSLSTHEALVMRDLDIRNFRAIQRQSMRFFENAFAGALAAKARRLRDAYEVITDLFFFQFGRNFAMFVVIAAVFTTTMPVLAVPFIVWAMTFVAYCIVTTWWKYRYDAAASKTDSKVQGALIDSLANHMVVKAFGQETAEEQRYMAVVQESHRARLTSWWLSDAIMIGQVLIMATGELALINWMITNWRQGIVSAGDFIFVQTFMAWAISHLWPFGVNLRRLFSSIANAEEMAEIHHLIPEVRDAAGARPLMIEKGEIEFHAVRFCYGGKPEKTKGAIHDLTLTIPPGQALGLVGKSGAGKSTLVKALYRLYDLDAGYIRIDGQDIANVTQVSLRQQLGAVLQHSMIFHRTIRENIALSRPDASEQEVIQAAQQACAWDFIQKLPDGLNTLVGEHGIKLSGGQLQRLAVARAILADPRILIFDEATSSLDGITEQVIQVAIANLLKDRTSIVIAHRLSTIMRLDRIVVMENGRIIESGTHEELLRLEGAYTDLWSHQVGGYIK